MWVSGSEVIPSKGDRVMQFRSGGLIREGYVWYADQLQVFVKWERRPLQQLAARRRFIRGFIE